MKKLKNRLKKMIVMLCTVAALLCCSLVPAFADEEASDPNLIGGVTTDGQIVPYLPEDVYGKNYILINMGNDSTSGSGRILCLYLLPDNAVVTAKNLSGSSNVYNGSGSQVISFSLPSGTYISRYYYRTSSGWSEPELVTSLNPTITPSYLFILRSTVTILNTDDNSVIYFAKNTDIIYKNDIKVFLDDFGGLLTGSIGVISSSIVGVVGAFIVITPAIVGLFYALLRRD